LTFGGNQRNQVEPHPKVQSVFGPEKSHEKPISAYEHPRSHLRKSSPGHPSSQIGLRQTCCGSCSRRASTSSWHPSHECGHSKRVRHQRHGNALSSNPVSMHGMSKTEGSCQHSADGSTSRSLTWSQAQAIRQCRSRLCWPVRHQDGQRKNQEEGLRACPYLHGYKEEFTSKQPAAWTLHTSSTLSHDSSTSEGCRQHSRQTTKLLFEKQTKKSPSNTRRSTGTPFRRQQDLDSGQTLTAFSGTSTRQMLLTSVASSKSSSRRSSE
jgi:hypothetical protein